MIARDVIDGRQRRQAREQGPQRREGRVLVGQVAGDRDEIGLRRADGIQQRRVLLAKDAAMQIGDLHNAQARKCLRQGCAAERAERGLHGAVVQIAEARRSQHDRQQPESRPSFRHGVPSPVVVFVSVA